MALNQTGIVVPGRDALLMRLESIRKPLEGTRFAFTANKDHVEAVCPWGNRIRCYEPGSRFGRMQLGMPYVQFDVPRGTAEGIVRFYREVLNAPGRVTEDGGRAACIAVGADQVLVFREADVSPSEFDGHHIAIYISDFSGPYKKLLARGLVSREDDQHQYRFQDIYDPKDGRVLFTIEHEVRSLHHPLYGRPFVNRNPFQSNQRFAPGHEQQSWSMPLGG